MVLNKHSMSVRITNSNSFPKSRNGITKFLPKQRKVHGHLKFKMGHLRLGFWWALAFDLSPN